MVSFSQAKDMFRLQREAKRIKKELKNVHVEAEGKFCKVTVTGEQEVLSIQILDASNTAALAMDLIDAINRAMKKAQVVAAERMQGIMGQMGMGVPDGDQRG